MVNRYLYSNVKEYILNMIKDLNEGERIPSRNEFMKLLNVTRVTVDRAVSELIGEGCLYAVDGSGTYVSGKKKAALLPINTIKSWGIIIDNIVSYVYPEIIRGVEDVASKNNINIIICNTDNDMQKQEMYMDKLLETSVSGIIIVPAVGEEIILNGFRKLKENNIHFVLCIRGVEGIKAPRVISNNFYGENIATKHLLDIGYHRVAFICMPMYSTAEQRLQGYTGALLERGYEIKDEYIVIQEADTNEETGYIGMKKLLQLPKIPDAVVTHNDNIAYGAYQAIVENGLKVPDNIGLVGYDDSEVCKLLPTKLTSVKYPKYETGTKAAEILLKMMNKEKDIALTTILNPRLIIRESCGFNKKLK